MNTVWAWSSGVLILFGLFLLGKRRNPNQSVPLITRPKIEKGQFPINQYHASPHWGRLRSYIAAQAAHETGGFTSRLALDQNNIFGMNIPSKRAFVGSKNSGNQYMTYSDWNQSVQDLLLWMKHTKFPLSVNSSKQYVDELVDRGYFTDNPRNYLGGMNRYLKELPFDPFVKIQD